MDKGREQIRTWSTVLLVFFILSVVLLVGLGIALKALDGLLENYLLYIFLVVMAVSLIGLFKYKKWGFYLFTIYLVYLLVENIRVSNFQALIIYLVFYGYFIWYRAFFKNFSSFE
jgi:hypothetical protein